MVNNMDTTAQQRRASRIAMMLVTGALACAVTACTGIGTDDRTPALTEGCITTEDHGCLAPAEFAERADAIAKEHRTHPGFAGQWGLTAIRADQGYAHLALAMGAGVQPGEGVTVGIIDSGIDRTHHGSKVRP